MAQVLVSRELYADTPHEAARTAGQQAQIWDASESLGLTQDYYPTVDMEAADLYIGGEPNMLEELLESLQKMEPYLRLYVNVLLEEDDDAERFKRFSFDWEVV